MGYMWGGSDPYKKAVRAKLTGDASGTAWGSSDPYQKPPKPKPPNYNEDYYNTAGDSAWNKTHPSTGGAPTHDYYAEAMASAERRRREEERRLREANRAAVNAGITTLQGQIPLINQGAYGQTTDAYVRNEQAKAAMPQQMAAMGNTGGMSESSMIGVNANYQNMVNGINQEKQNALNGIQGDIARLQSEGDMNLANQLAQSSDKYYEQMIRNQMAQAAAQEKSQPKAGSGLTASQAISAYNNNIRTPAVLNKLTELYGEEFVPDNSYLLESEKMKKWINKAEENQTRYPQTGSISKAEQLRNAVESAFDSGYLSYEEAAELARLYGFTITQQG